MSDMRIVEIRSHVAPPTPSWVNDTMTATPMSAYPQFKQRRSSWRGPSSQTVYVEIVTDQGLVGVGETRGGAVTKAIIDEHLTLLLIGRDPRQIELLWDQMYRATLPYGRKGVPIMAISAIDLALWDLLAKDLDQPLYMLLGGAVRDSLPMYATHPDPRALAAEGYVGLKVPMAYGPADGLSGLRANLERVEDARSAVGPDVDLMVDCFMAWDVEYTLDFAHDVEPYRIRWIEESLSPDDYEGYAELRRRMTKIRIATGEHEYTRWGFRELLERGCADVIQPDVTWAGGITEARRIAALASAFNIQVIPHAGALQPWTVHWMYATPNCPLAESIVLDTVGGDQPRPMLINTLKRAEGVIRPSNGPGAGVTLRADGLGR